MPLATLADVVAVEAAPVAERFADGSTIAMLARVAREYGDRIALRSIVSGLPDEPTLDLSYAAFFRRIVQAANLFHALGAAPSFAVSSLLPIVADAFVAMFAAHAAAVANPINFLLEREQIAALLRAARCRVLLAPDPDVFPGVWEKIETIAADVPTLRAILRVGGPAVRADSAALHFETELERRPAQFTFTREIAPGDVAALFHTGGTTSAPKLARHTHRGLLLQAWTNAQVWRPGPDEVVFNGLPPFHVGGAICSGISPLSQGATVVLLTPAGNRNPNVVKHFWRHIERFRPTVVPMVPTSWSAVMNVPVDGCDLSSVRLCHAGGAAMPLELARDVAARLAAPVVEGWGMTELHGFGSMGPAAGTPRIGSVGLRVPYLEIVTAAVADGRIERIAPAGEIGSVLVRGHALFAGYTDAVHDAAGWIEPMNGDLVPAWSPGGPWFDTGDLGRFDDDGCLWLTGRAKDVIIRGGHNIDPLVIEQALSAHPAVALAAAVGRPDAHAGELPVGFVQLRPDATAAPEELLAFARERIPERAAVPVEVLVLEALPLTGVGKVFKPALRDIAARLVFDNLIRSLAGAGSAFEVDVAAHPVHGRLMSVRFANDVDDTTFASIRRELDRHSIRYEIAHPAGVSPLTEREVSRKH